MNPKFNYQFADLKWHDVKMCNNCGHIYQSWQCAHPCVNCGEQTTIGNNTRMTVRWVGIPFIPIGKFEIKE